MARYRLAETGLPRGEYHRVLVVAANGENEEDWGFFAEVGTEGLTGGGADGPAGYDLVIVPLGTDGFDIYVPDYQEDQ